MRAKKHLGQNFLTSTQAVFETVSATDIKSSDTILEIGPGKGILTKKILSSGANIITIEKDSELIPKLETQFEEEIKNGKLEIIQGDFLELFPEGNLTQSTKYKVIANIPYYITGQILRTLLSGEKQPESITLVVQKEVAERIVCREGKESILSLSVNVYGNSKYIRKIPARYFNPKPKVDSAIIHIENISKNNFKSPKEELLFFSLIKTGFIHKRKLLIKNLNKAFNKEILEKAFISCDIPPKTRAEDVSLDKWLCLLKKLKK